MLEAVATEKCPKCNDMEKNFVLIGNNREEAYRSHINFEMGFEPDVRNDMSYKEFCKELDMGYGNANYLQTARLYEDKDGKIYYDNDFVM